MVVGVYWAAVLRPELEKGALGSLLACLLAASGCSSILGLDDGTALVPDAGLDAIVLPDVPTVPTVIHVDAIGGDDTEGTGSADAPFQSITQATLNVVPGWTIRVAPGTYANESFPIDISGSQFDGIKIVGEPGQTIVQAGGSGILGVFDLGANTLEGLSISNSDGDTVVRARFGSVIKNCTISASNATGLTIDGGDVEVRNTVIQASAVGVLINAAGEEPVFVGNDVINNDVGIEALQSFSLDGAEGANTFSCNANADLRAADGAAINADNNTWDHLPPTDGNFGGGIDVTRVGGATVSTENAELASDPCP